jgi:hypothetical protein
MSVAPVHGQYEPCEECGALLDPQQRYCVNCAARRGNGANPSSRYFATMSKRANRPPPRPGAAKSGSGSRAAAVGFFALLPIAVAIGVVVGRSGNDGSENQALLEALRNPPATVAGTSAAAGMTASKAAKAGKGKAAKSAAKGGGKVVAQTSNGAVHQVAGYKPPQKKVEEDTKLVEENPEQVGDNYIKAQQNLPDVIVVGGEGGSAPSSSGGAGEP